MYFCIVLVVMLPLQFLILFKSSFFLVNLANVCLFCLPFQRSRTLFSCSFLLFFWSLFHVFISSLSLIVSFLQLTVGLIRSLSRSLRCKVKYFNQNPCNFLIYAFIAVNFSLKMLLLLLTRFYILNFHFHLF